MSFFLSYFCIVPVNIRTLYCRKTLFFPSTQHFNISLANLYSGHKAKENEMRRGIQCDTILDCFQVSFSTGICPEQAGPLTNNNFAKNREGNLIVVLSMLN
jgi:hypothetical protein